MRFSATEAAFEGFRLARRRPLTILIWAALVFAFSLAMTTVLILLAGPALVQMQALNQQTAVGGTADAAQALGLMGTLGPAYALMAVIGLIYYALLLPAVERSVLDPERGGPGFVQLGGVELRHVGTIAVVGLAVFIAYIVVVIVVTVATAVLGTTVGLPVAIGVAVIAGLAGLAGLIWLMARFALAGPAALREGGIGVGRSWTLTKGRVWPIAGGLVLSGVLAAVVALLVLAIFGGGAAAFGAGVALGTMFQPDMSSAAAYFTPFTLIYMAVSSISSALGFAILVGYGANVYQQLVGPTASQTADAFS